MGVLLMQRPGHLHCEAINHPIKERAPQAHLATDSNWSRGWGGFVATTARGPRTGNEGSESPIIKRFGSITIIFVTVLLAGPKAIDKHLQRHHHHRRRATTERRTSATAQSKEEIKSTANVVVGQRIVGSATAASTAIRSCSSSPSLSKRKFQFQYNRTSPYDPPVIHQLTGKAGHVAVQVCIESEDAATTSLTVAESNSTVAAGGAASNPLETTSAGSPRLVQLRLLPSTDSRRVSVPAQDNNNNSPGPVIRPVDLLHRRKVYVEGPQLVGSSSSELSTVAVAGDTTIPLVLGTRNCNRAENPREQPDNLTCIAAPTVVVGSRQISPASCNSESAASGAGACGLCGLMPHCAILDSVKARKIRGNKVIVEEEAGASSTETLKGVETTGGSTQVGLKPAATESSSAAVVGVSRNRISKYNSTSMDRSVDSIGSCSLDVDADSTDFSDTSGSFNLLTPSSAKDFPREFITRIHERCQIQPLAHHNNQSLRQHLQQQLQQQQQPHHQQTSIVLDPQSGKVNTVLEVVSTQSPEIEPLKTITISEEPKKPSYLNLACCVNGYSNLTTYDSKFRQNINKSREVSPIRPITTTTSQPGSVPLTSASGHLVVPANSFYYPTTNQPVGHGIPPSMDQQAQPRSVMSPEKRLFTSHIMQSSTLSSTTTTRSNGGDMTDNARNGCSETLQFRTTKYLQSKYSHGDSPARNGTVTAAEVTLAATEGSPYKSFIEQRVERLYGPGALAQGFHANRRSMEKTVLSERNIYSNTPTRLGSGCTGNSPLKAMNGNGTGGIYTPKRVAPNQGTNEENEKHLEDTIPVLRHLRPEFRAQLPISSPKRSPPPKESTNGRNGVKAPEEAGEVLVDQPIKLQFQTVSISKLQTGTTNKFIANGSSAKIGDANERHLTVVVNRNEATTSRAGENAETIEHNNREPDNRESGGVCDDIISEINNTTRQLSTIEIGAGVVVDKEPASEKLISKSDLCEEQPTKMPSKQEVENKENVIAGGGVGASGKMEKDGNYFLDVLNIERNRILELADIIDKYMDEYMAGQDVSEEIVGILRSASGKARLLAAQKIIQFQGLCHNNLTQSPDEKFPTTCEDLQGFWDMVMLQVNHIDELFKEIEAIKKNNWTKCADSTDSLPPPQGAKLLKRPVTKTATRSAEPSAATQKREAQRKQLMELKRKNKLAMAGGESAE